MIGEYSMVDQSSLSEYVVVVVAVEAAAWSSLNGQMKCSQMYVK